MQKHKAILGAAIGLGAVAIFGVTALATMAMRASIRARKRVALS